MAQHCVTEIANYRMNRPRGRLSEKDIFKKETASLHSEWLYVH